MRRSWIRPVLLAMLAGWAAAASAGAEADLAVSVVDTPDPVAAGAPLVYSVTVWNFGPDAATGVQLTNILPSAVSFVRVQILRDAIFADGFESGSTTAWGSAAGAACSVAGRIVSCLLGPLPAGDEVLVRIEVTVSANAAGQLSNLATVGSSSADSVPGNDSAATSTTVTTPSADLSLAMSDAPDPVAPGGLLTYTLTVTNLGPGEAPASELLDALPPEVAFVGSSRPCSQEDGLLVCPLGTIAAGAVADTSITVRVGEKAAFNITNPAAVGSSAVDGNPGNNQDSEVTAVGSRRAARP